MSSLDKNDQRGIPVMPPPPHISPQSLDQWVSSNIRIIRTFELRPQSHSPFRRYSVHSFIQVSFDRKVALVWTPCYCFALLISLFLADGFYGKLQARLQGRDVRVCAYYNINLLFQTHKWLIYIFVDLRQLIATMNASLQSLNTWTKSSKRSLTSCSGTVRTVNSTCSDKALYDNQHMIISF